MLAYQIMSREIITASPDMEVSEVARILFVNKISALPVVDGGGNVVGIISEDDFILGKAEEKRAKKEWWLGMLAEGEALSSDFLKEIKCDGCRARDIMTSPVITVSEETNIEEIAKLLNQYKIKRVPVLSGGKMVGIVSRADLIMAMTTGVKSESLPHSQNKGFFSRAIEAFHHSANNLSENQPKPLPEAHSEQSNSEQEKIFSASHFQKLVKNFYSAKRQSELSEQEKIKLEHEKQVEELIKHHLEDEEWKNILKLAEEAAIRGEKEFMILRFPNELCSDGGRAINISENNWQETLRGETAEIYIKWQRDLRPQGFHLSAKVLEYPNGFIGDIGLFLGW